MARKITDNFQMAAALLELDHEMTEHKKYIESIEAEVNQQDQELDVLIDKLIELETENMYLRIILNKLLSEKDFALEDLFNNENTREETK